MVSLRLRSDSCWLEDLHRLVVLVCGIAESIDASCTCSGHSSESTRCQIRDSESQSEVFMLFSLVNEFICFQQISHASLSLSTLQHFHNELKNEEQLLRYPLQTSVDASELMTFRCRELVIQLFRTLKGQTRFRRVLHVRFRQGRNFTVGVFLALPPAKIHSCAVLIEPNPTSWSSSFVFNSNVASPVGNMSST